MVNLEHGEYELVLTMNNWDFSYIRFNFVINENGEITQSEPIY